VLDGPVTIGLLAQVINVLQKEVDAAALIQIRKSWIKLTIKLASSSGDNQQS
jgi:hypothetical protein